MYAKTFYTFRLEALRLGWYRQPCRHEEFTTVLDKTIFRLLKLKEGTYRSLHYCNPSHSLFVRHIQHILLMGWIDSTFHPMISQGWSFSQLSLHLALKVQLSTKTWSHLGFEWVPVKLHQVFFKIPCCQGSHHFSQKHPVFESSCMPHRDLKLPTAQLGVFNLVLERQTAFTEQCTGWTQARAHNLLPGSPATAWPKASGCRQDHVVWVCFAIWKQPNYLYIIHAE